MGTGTRAHLSCLHPEHSSGDQLKLQAPSPKQAGGRARAGLYLVAVDTFVGALPRVDPHVLVQAGGLGEALPTHRALGEEAE